MMVEVQSHGFEFERWLRINFFDGFLGGYSDKWDIPKEHNASSIVPEAMRRLPVSIKTAKYGTPIGLGDALRQCSINEDFLLIVGYWIQSGEFKTFNAVEPVRVSVSLWKNLWAPLRMEDLSKLDRLIKDRTQPYQSVRAAAQKLKLAVPYKQSKLVLNPKIDSKVQRRLQCSLSFSTFWSELAGKSPASVTNASIFGRAVPNPFRSAPRKFSNRDSSEETFF